VEGIKSNHGNQMTSASKRKEPAYVTANRLISLLLLIYFSFLAKEEREGRGAKAKRVSKNYFLLFFEGKAVDGSPYPWHGSRRRKLPNPWMRWGRTEGGAALTRHGTREGTTKTRHGSIHALRQSRVNFVCPVASTAIKNTRGGLRRKVP